MIVDAQTVDRARFARYFDICIVGSGPAGITLARTLAAKGLDVALMEGGARDLTEESQSLYEGEIAGLDTIDLDVARLRFFGGSSGHWNGKCKEMEAVDFEPRPGHPLSGWPIAKADLDPYQAATDAILDLPSSDGFGDRPVGDSDDFRAVGWRRSPPTRFAEKYEAELAASGAITLCLNANLVDLRLDEEMRRVTGAVFRSYRPDDPGFTVEAREYALCLGGLENPRMLLNFRSQMPGGIGNRNDLVGRFFCDHPTVEVADILFEKAPEIREETYVPSAEYLHENAALKVCYMVLHKVPTPYSVPKRILRTGQCATGFTRRLAEAVRGRPVECIWGGTTEYALFADPVNNPSGEVWVGAESPLLADSRVMLDEDVDPFGLNRIRLDWRLDEAFYRNLQETTVALGATLAEQGVGRIRIRDWLRAENPVLPNTRDNQGSVGSRHHMCTTRMSDDPRQGVVDRDCRVHGISNLSIGGSSVFATTSYVNPTYTIVQLALRLGDHLGQVLQA